MRARRQAPLHERLAPLGWVRDRLRRAFFGFLRRLANTDDARDILSDSLRGLLRTGPALPLVSADAAETPYPDLGRPEQPAEVARAGDPVFITARFRTGSTLL